MSLAGTVEALEEWASKIREAAERSGLSLIARHASLVEEEAKTLRRISNQIPSREIKRRVRMLHAELNWIENEMRTSLDGNP